MRLLTIAFLLTSCVLSGQVMERTQDTLTYDYYYIEGDSIPMSSIQLDEVQLLHKLKFDSRKDRLRYLILKRKTIKVYPYAKLASERLNSLNSRLSQIKRKRERRRYTRLIQRYIEGEFSDELKKLTRTEGQILVKLVYRQTGFTTFELVKELRNGWRAFWYNNTASLFDISLKRTYDPLNVKEDYLIEDILQRSFRDGRLEYQEPAIPIDFFMLTEKWLQPNKNRDSSATTNRD